MAEQLVRLTTVFSLIEARVLASKLDAYGIPAVIPTEFVSVTPHLMVAHGGVSVNVVRCDLDVARALLVPDHELEPQPRRRGLEALAGLLILLHGVPPAPAPAFARSQLRFAGPLAIVLVLASLLTSSETWTILLVLVLDLI